MKKSLFQRIFEAVSGVEEVGLIQRPGWSAPIMHYRFRCPRHGLVVNYPMGHSETLWCPKCHAELVAESVNTQLEAVR